MHSRVFCVVEELEKDKIEEAMSIDEVEIVESIRGCDYAVERYSTEEMQDDVERLASWIKIKDIHSKTICLEDEDITYWVIPVEKLKIAIEKDIKDRIAEIKEELKKENPSLHQIAFTAYNQKGFFFYMPGYGVMNEIDLYELLLNTEKGKNLPYLYVVKTFDYHF